jgi:putative endonuclease
MDARRKFGNDGESLVCSYLEKQGFTILQRNYATRSGEVDIIAQQNLLICFIEVKTRAKHHAGLGEIITRTKQMKIILTAKHYLSQLKYPAYIARFDVAFVVESDTHSPITYIPNAFNEE